MLRPGVEFKSVKRDAPFANGHDADEGAHEPVERVLVHAQIGGGYPKAEQSRCEGKDVTCLCDEPVRITGARLHDELARALDTSEAANDDACDACVLAFASALVAPVLC